MNLLLSIVDWIGTYIVFMPFVALGFVILAAVLSDIGVKHKRYINLISHVVTLIIILSVLIMFLSAFAEIYRHQ